MNLSETIAMLLSAMVHKATIEKFQVISGDTKSARRNAIRRTKDTIQTLNHRLTDQLVGQRQRVGR